MDHIKIKLKFLKAVDSCNTAVENPNIAINQLFSSYKLKTFYSRKYGKYVSDVIFEQLLNRC